MSVGTKIGVAFTIAFVVLLAVGGTAYVSTQRLLEANRLVFSTQDIQERLEDVIAVHVDAENGQRGFIITGEERYLEPYNSAVGRIQKDIETLTSLTRDNIRTAGRSPATPKAFRRQAGRTAGYDQAA